MRLLGVTAQPAVRVFASHNLTLPGVLLVLLLVMCGDDGRPITIIGNGGATAEDARTIVGRRKDEQNKQDAAQRKHFTLLLTHQMR